MEGITKTMFYRNFNEEVFFNALESILETDLNILVDKDTKVYLQTMEALLLCFKILTDHSFADSPFAPHHSRLQIPLKLYKKYKLLGREVFIYNRDIKNKQ